MLGSIYSHVIISLHLFHAVGPGRVCCGHWSVLESNSEQSCLYCGLGLEVAIGSSISPVWCVISDNTDTRRNSRTRCSWMLCCRGNLSPNMSSIMWQSFCRRRVGIQGFCRMIWPCIECRNWRRLSYHSAVLHGMGWVSWRIGHDSPAISW